MKLPFQKLRGPLSPIRLLAIIALALPLHGSEFKKGGIHEAAFNGELGIVRKLLANEPRLLDDTSEGGTPLFAATFLYRKEVIEFLLSKGADVNLPDSQGLSPLHLAAYQGYADVVKLLLDAKANPSAKSEDGSTPLHKAAESDRNEAVELLIAAKSDVNARNANDLTPLHIAANLPTSLKTLAALVAGGSDMSAKAEKGKFAGKTPLELNESLSRLATLAPDWGRSDINIPEDLKEEVRILRYMSYALRSFSEKYGSYPTDQTAATLEKSFNETIRLRGGTADDFFKQLHFTTDFPESVGASVTKTAVLGKTDWTCSYVPGGAFQDNPDRPVVLIPLLDGEHRFDKNALGGRAIVLFADCSVRYFPVEPDGQVLINKLDILDPKQPYWENSKPDIKWPHTPGR